VHKDVGTRVAGVERHALGGRRDVEGVASVPTLNVFSLTARAKQTVQSKAPHDVAVIVRHVQDSIAESDGKRRDRQERMGVSKLAVVWFGDDTNNALPGRRLCRVVLYHFPRFPGKVKQLIS
jgi:hypothetical protein